MLFNYNKEVGAFEFGTKGKSNPEQNFLKSVAKNGFDKNGNLDADAVLKISDKFEDANVKTKAWVVNLAKGTEQLKEGQTAAEAINEKIVNSGFSFKKLGGSVKGLLGSIGASMLNMGIATVASFAVTGITKLVDKLIVTKKELAEMRKAAIDAGKTAQEEINSTFKALSDNTKTIESIEDRFSELSKGVDEKTGKNLSLTNDEYEEFLGYNQQIIEMFPDVSRIYTENGDAIAQLGDYADTTSEALKSLIEQQRLVANLELQEKLPTIYEGIKSQSDTYSEKIKQYKKDIEDYADAINNLPDLKDSFNNVTGNGFLTISDTDYNDKLRSGIEKMLKASGIESKNYNWSHNKAAGEYYLNFYTSDAALDEFRQNFDLYSSQVLTIYNQKLSELQNSLSTTNIQSGNNWNGLTSSVISYLTNDNNYIMLSDEMQNYVQMAINNTDWGKLNFDSWEDLTNYIDGTLITLFQGEHGQELADAVDTMSKHEEEYKTGKITYDEYIDYINKYRSALYRYITSEDEKARLSFWDLFSYDDEEASVERLKNSVSDLPDNWKLSEDEMQIALEIIAELDGKPITWADLKNQIEEKMSDIEVDAKVNIQNSSAVKSLNDLDTDWAGLDTVYSSTVTTAGTAEAKDIESVNSAMGGVSKAGDEEINSLSNAIEAYDTALVESKGDTVEAQKAVNKLTTAYIDQSGVLDDLDESNAKYYIDMLTSKGITNAEEVVMSRLSDTAKRTAKNIKELSKVLVNNYNVLKNSSKGSKDYNKSMSEIKDATTNLLSYEQDGEIIIPTLSDEFILQNLEDIKAATEGDIEALNRLRIEAAKEIVADIKINAPSQEIMGIQNEINQLIDSFDIENIEIGANLDDTAMIQGLNNLVKAGYITRDDMNSALASIGVVPEETGYVDIPISTFGSISNAVAASGLKGIAATEAAKGYSKLDSTAKIRVPSFGYKLANKATGSRYGGAKSSSSGGGGGGGGGGGSSSEPTKPKDESEEMFDWVEIAIQRLQEAEQRLSKEVGNTYSLWTKRNENLSKEIQNVTDQINAQRLAAQEYQKYYNSIQVNSGKGLNADDYGENDELVRQHDQALLDEANRLWATGEYQRKVMSGQLSGDDIEKIANHFLTDAIKEFQEFYNKSVAASDAVQDLTINLGELAETKFNNVKSEYDELIAYITAYADIIDERINRTEEHGYFVSKNYYKQLIDYENQELTKLQKEYNDLVSARDSAVSSGAIKQGSSAWNQMNQEILGVQKSLEESTTQLVEYNNAIRDLDWEIFDWLEERISRITDETEFLVDLMSNDQLYEDDGRLTALGEATNGLYAIQYETLMRQAKDYAEERIKLEKEIAKDPANKELIERYEELVDAQQDAISGAEQMKDAVKSLVEEGINKNIEALDKLITKYTEAMDNAKDLYDYQKNIENQVKNIANLEKTLNAYAGDDSEEARKIRQQTQKSLEDARQQLEETEWDRMISETKNLLTDLKEDYEETLMARLDDIDALMADMIDEANSQGTNIANTIKSVAKESGYTLTTELSDILSGDTIASGFKASFDTYATGTNATLGEIKEYVAAIANQTTAAVVDEKKINSNVGTTTNSTNTGSTANGTKNTSTQKPSINTVRNGIDYSSIFDLDYYMKNNPDLVKAFGNNYDSYLTHFIDFGMKEGRQASEKFDVNYYKSNYGDLQAAFGNDLAKYYQHYLTYGIKEGRQGSKSYVNYNYNGLDFSSIFDPKYYANKYPDLKKAFGDNAAELFNHFITYGMKEGRQAISTFNPETYKKRYADLQAAFGNDWTQYYAHYLIYGKNEGRKAYAKGSRRIPNDQLAWTQEKGSEIIYRSSDGAMLTPLGAGDMVFTNEMSQRLYDLASSNISGVKLSGSTPNIKANVGNNVTNQNAISFTLPNVRNYDEFVSEMKRDGKFANYIQEITFGQASGKNTLRKNMY